ncbi:MAG: hypothetical protein HY606_10290 [Planctomycetes bacterium]|nr:hypothetical protein [Planctomycetota bacterium]
MLNKIYLIPKKSVTYAKSQTNKKTEVRIQESGAGDKKSAKCLLIGC